MDVIFKNSKVYDGSKSTPYIADVQIKDGKIAAISDHLSGANEKDCRGLCLAPGFIDVHTHSDSQIYVEPSRYCKAKQGVTFEIGGQCGWSRAPLSSSASKEAVDYLGTIYPVKNYPMYATFAKQMEAAERIPLGIHQASFVGHHLIRGSVVGMENRPATADEIRQMIPLVEEAMTSGAMGLSTGLVYAPGCYSTLDELIELMKVVSRYNGIHTTHMRDEGDFLEKSVADTIRIAKETGVRTNISHIKAMYSQNWHKTEHVLKMIDDANASGCDIAFDAYPYEACSATILSTLPPSYLSHDMDWLVDHLTGEKAIRELADAIYHPTEQWENPVRNIGLDKILIVIAMNSPDAVGKTVAEYAQLRGIEPIAAYAEIIAKSRGKASDVRFAMSNESIQRFYQHPLCMVGTDGLYTHGKGLTHPRAFGTFPRFLGRLVRDHGIMSFAEGIHRITGQAADWYGLKNKGYIRAGYDADLVLFDEDRLIDHADYLDPYIPNEGIHRVYVMGDVLVERNAMTEVRNGTLYRKFNINSHFLFREEASI